MTTFHDIAADILPCNLEQGCAKTHDGRQHYVTCPAHYRPALAKALQDAYEKGVEDGIKSYRE